VEIYLGSEESTKCPGNEEDCEEVTRNNVRNISVGIIDNKIWKLKKHFCRHY
jgi:hypothetical protein